MVGGVANETELRPRSVGFQSSRPQSGTRQTLRGAQSTHDPGRFVPGPVRSIIGDAVMRSALQDLKAHLEARSDDGRSAGDDELERQVGPSVCRVEGLNHDGVTLPAGVGVARRHGTAVAATKRRVRHATGQ